MAVCGANRMAVCAHQLALGYLTQDELSASVTNELSE